MSETLKKAAAKAKETQEKVSAAVAAARTRSGAPKVIKPEPPAPAPKAEPVDVGARLDAFIAQETQHLSAVDVPDDTGDAMYNAVQAILYHKERISKAELAKKYLQEG
jgi:hypothetical protein